MSQFMIIQNMHHVLTRYDMKYTKGQALRPKTIKRRAEQHNEPFKGKRAMIKDNLKAKAKFDPQKEKENEKKKEKKGNRGSPQHEPD
ncbi:hypothetical protein I7I53_07745 [Histoplasma capsulatum var. duboisii H88]|uniref:Uncharacterized protein n=1 Tax=Ajellomyces capsulatus (strain H88) TaxID=544711 RepID=A0A8A1LGZ0_AJEC8|nr:hypothetical protein I7I53_07745 [Histoplasma capsulatum var. duboisii H88]